MPLVELPDEVTSAHADQIVQAHIALMTETRGNFQHSNNVLISSANKKMAEIGPLEAAAAEVVMKINPNLAS